MTTLLFEEIVSLASECGLYLVGVTSAHPLIDEQQRVHAWQREGYAGEMRYLMRDPELLTSPHALMPDAECVISVAVRYDQAPHPPRPMGFGRIARYAWGKDYHVVLQERLFQCSALLARRGIRTAVFTDAVPLLERAIARRGNMGFIGKNTLLITPGIGSQYFLGEILINASVERPPRGALPPGTCGSCSRCRTECPTGALVADTLLDARLCISYLTIEKKGMLSYGDRRRIGEWIFGCDICQEVCPFNYTSIKKRISPDLPEFSPSCGVGPLLSLEKLFSLSDSATFKSHYSGTPLMRPKREGLIRNGLCVAVNTNSFFLIPFMDRLFLDSSPVIRATALWAYAELARMEGVGERKIETRLQPFLDDPAPVVSHEVRGALSGWEP